VLVGGEGTRLRPLTFTTPKPLLPIAGQPFVERQLSWLARYGIDEVVLSLGYLPDAFVEHFPDGRFGEMHLRYAVESEPLDTAGAVRFAAGEFGIDETFIVCNGDVLTTLDLEKFVQFHHEHDAQATIHLTQVEDPSRFGLVPTAPDGEVQEFVEKPPPGEAPTNWINAGTYVLEPAVLERIEPNTAVSIERVTFPALLEQRGQVYAMGTEDYWIDIGKPESFIAASADVVAGRLGAPPVDDAHERSPGIWIGKEADIADDATLEPPVLIGAGSVIGANARLTRATIGRRCTIGAKAVIENAVVLDGARLDSDARVQASILGAGSCVQRDAAVLETSIVGERAVIDAGTTISSGRVPLAAAAS
jgi:mannose-1-phosphate guanylyltransferase